MRGGIEGGGKTSGGQKTRWGHEEVESMLMQRRWDTDGTGVRAQLLAQKELHQLQSGLDNQTWRHPVARIAAIWGVWRRLWRS